MTDDSLKEKADVIDFNQVSYFFHAKYLKHSTKNITFADGKGCKLVWGEPIRFLLFYLPPPCILSCDTGGVFYSIPSRQIAIADTLLFLHQ